MFKVPEQNKNGHRSETRTEAKKGMFLPASTQSNTGHRELDVLLLLLLQPLSSLLPRNDPSLVFTKWNTLVFSNISPC